jgi:heme-degrading monooxygenase HmoA
MIKVVIERHVKDGCQTAYKETISKAKKAASHTDGYISGEILIDSSDKNHILVLSTWESRDSWISWANSAERLEVLESISSLLVSEEAVSIYNLSN